MLVLTRKPGESIQIADEITLTVVRTHTNRVKLAIAAPESVAISRSERASGRKPRASTARSGG